MGRRLTRVPKGGLCSIVASIETENIMNYDSRGRGRQQSWPTLIHLTKIRTKSWKCPAILMIHGL